MTENTISKTCSIIMPISQIESCSENHWDEVRNIFFDAVSSAGFTGNIVSNIDDASIIQRRTVQSLYDTAIVICDVSGKNPNVMFELGMRLAFDKPTIIVKDDCTNYSFDSSIVDILEYPRNLRYSDIIEFKENLAEKIKHFHEKITSAKPYNSFLKHFGGLKVAKLDQMEVSGQEFILEELRQLRAEITKMDNKASFNFTTKPAFNTGLTGHANGKNLDDISGPEAIVRLENADSDAVNKLLSEALNHPGIMKVDISDLGDGYSKMIANLSPDFSTVDIKTDLLRLTAPFSPRIRIKPAPRPNGLQK